MHYTVIPGVPMLSVPTLIDLLTNELIKKKLRLISWHNAFKVGMIIKVFSVLTEKATSIGNYGLFLQLIRIHPCGGT